MALEFDIDDPYRKRVAAKLPDVGDLTPAKPLPQVDFGSPTPTPAPLPKVSFQGPTLTAGNMQAITSPDDLARTQATAPGRFDLEALRQRLGFGRADLSNPQAWLDANRDVAQGVTIRGDKLYDPSGRFMADAIGNFKTGGTRSQFLDGIDTGRQKQQAAKSKVREPSTGFNVGPIGGAPGGGAPPAANNFLTQIRQLIMARLGKMSGDPSLDDPALAAQSAAYRRSRERGATSERAAMAERAAQQGLLQGGASSGGFDTNLQGIREGVSEDVAGNDARLLGSEASARRNEVQSLLNMALASGDAESARVLQAQLAQLDAQLRREALRENARQYNLGDKYRYSALGENRRQFDDQFGRGLNRDAEDDYRYRVNYGLGG